MRTLRWMYRLIRQTRFNAASLQRPGFLQVNYQELTEMGSAVAEPDAVRHIQVS